jgi:hypothetical protein
VNAAKACLAQLNSVTVRGGHGGHRDPPLPGATTQPTDPGDECSAEEPPPRPDYEEFEHEQDEWS